METYRRIQSIEQIRRCNAATGENMKKTILGMLILLASCAFVYGLFVTGKILSYQFMYKDMVQQTIKETVKPEYLKGKK